MLARGARVLAGPSLEDVEADVRVTGGSFSEVGPDLRAAPGEEVLDCSGMLAVPGLVNAHTHVGDSVAKGISDGLTVEGAVHPAYGAKRRVLSGTPPALLEGMMRSACRLMLSKGVTTFADFREGGLEGARMLRRAASGIPIRCLVFGRLEHYPGPGGGPLDGARRAELAALLAECDGIGISGANENPDPVLEEYGATGRAAIHAAESAQSVAASLERTGRGEVERALLARPLFLVHMVHAGPGDLGAARAARGIVACPRSNAALGAGAPDIRAMSDAGCTVALGTDNVMVNSPDMFREMDYASRSAEAAGRPVPARDVLRMATVNGARVLGTRGGQISPGADADMVLLDARSLELAPVHDPYEAVVHRATDSSVRAVVAGGRVVHGA
ncbi:MAG: amidohydrolase family protein [Nitrosopumilus sp.]|nr:amidohydrolase family protein [Nitrosopumilus sp.]MDA7958166.1 amidohydrolase family protein [Nitrosopumilus sp.]